MVDRLNQRPFSAPPNAFNIGLAGYFRVERLSVRMSTEVRQYRQRAVGNPAQAEAGCA